MIPKFKCDGCGKTKRRRHIIYFKGKYLCSTCRQVYRMNLGKHNSNFTLEECLDKVYEIRGYLAMYKGKPNIQASCSFPSILIGHKVKLVLVK